ncbi:glycosyltransferase family 2 protein [bacterium]|nr:glycosyltransferase family 2 protein [bacterium]
MNDAAELSIIIVSWNVRDMLRDCLHSIENNRGEIRLEVWVVDNNSSDQSAQMVAREFPQVRLTVLEKNLGFGAANNIALRQVDSDFVLLLNPDTIVLEGALQQLIVALRQRDTVGIIGPQILNGKRRIDRSCRRFPTMPVALHQYTVFKHLKMFQNAHRRYVMSDFDHAREHAVDQLMGACMLIRREVFERVGWFDERFFMYYEEVDLCYRAKQAGFDIVYWPQAQIVHLSDQSTHQVWNEMLFRKIQSLLFYFTKTRGRIKNLIFRFFFKPGFVMKMYCEFFEYNLKYLLVRIKGGNDSDEESVRYRKRAHQTREFVRFYTRAVISL